MNAPIVTLLLLGCALLRCAAVGEPRDSRFAQVYDKDHPVEFKPTFANRADWEKRAEFVRNQALVALGLWPMPQKTPLNPVIHGKIDRDVYTIEKVYFASMPGHYVSGNLYRPKGRTGKLPVVLSPYGHWPSGRFIWKDDNGLKKDADSGAERDPIASRSPLQANCAMLARMGCIVFIYDMVGYCDSERLPIKHREGFTDAEAVMRCQSFMGLQTWNSIRSLDFVLSLPDVDPQRIAVTGSSSGGTQTIALCLADPRPAVSFPMVMVGMNMQGGCVCENAPLYRVGTNNVELATLFAPKPEGAAAANDWTVDFMTRGLPEMKAIWKLYDAENLVDGGHVDFGHNHNVHSRELQYAFLNKHLKLGRPEPVREEKFEPVPPKDLAVYDDEHPVPADAADAKKLREHMTRASDAQLGAMTADERAKTLRVALEAMLVDSMPTKDEVECHPPIAATRGSWSGTIGRKHSGERVPCKLAVPDRWDGRVIVTAGAAPQIGDTGVAVLSVEMFGSDSFKAPPAPATKPERRANPNPPYFGGYVLGYNRGVIANRAHDLFTAVAVARGFDGTKSVSILALGDAGPPALLARAVAGDAIDRAAIDLNHFDFDQITDDADPMLLPGALKYGGISGFVSLCANCPTRLSGLRHPVSPTPGVTVDANPDRLIQWLMEAN